MWIGDPRDWEGPWRVAGERGGRVGHAAGVWAPLEGVEPQPVESAEFGLSEPAEVIPGDGDLPPGVVGCQAGHGLSLGQELQPAGGIVAPAQPIFQTWSVERLPSDDKESPPLEEPPVAQIAYPSRRSSSSVAS
jgi:hypothetical protein